ncbi:hypothetical protein Lfu02_02210 [Longispora fulva]|uniref:Uncharacterized protein n=1 Tax=Longispora fulva TaxID=619741 RepID=A0A8J7GGU3_9ACTN|nr:hypothetical protein [Longispora fulva]GIG55849.1 hypothetical protein Lfu02_02210 [Longispora fulva]
MPGGNDAQRLTGGFTRLDSQAETARDPTALRDLASGPAVEVWLTPSAVDEHRIAVYPHFERTGLSWANEDREAQDAARHLFTARASVVRRRGGALVPACLSPNR